jgi:hypothetical protein
MANSFKISSPAKSPLGDLGVQKDTGIENFSRTYYLLKKYIIFFMNRFYRISIANSDNRTPGEHIIYTPNHHNALIDALALHATLNADPIFMARSDIFAKKPLQRSLTYLKFYPFTESGMDTISFQTISRFSNRLFRCWIIKVLWEFSLREIMMAKRNYER